jgi:hypothetical protein
MRGRREAAPQAGRHRISPRRSAPRLTRCCSQSENRSCRPVIPGTHPNSRITACSPGCDPQRELVCSHPARRRAPRHAPGNRVRRPTPYLRQAERRRIQKGHAPGSRCRREQALRFRSDRTGARRERDSGRGVSGNDSGGSPPSSRGSTHRSGQTRNRSTYSRIRGPLRPSVCRWMFLARRPQRGRAHQSRRRAPVSVRVRPQLASELIRCIDEIHAAQGPNVVLI